MSAVVVGWVIWTYAMKPGWEAGGGSATRDMARLIRDELIERDGYPPEFVAIRRAGEPRPARRPPRAVIERVRAELAAGGEG